MENFALINREYLKLNKVTMAFLIIEDYKVRIGMKQRCILFLLLFLLALHEEKIIKGKTNMKCNITGS